jgi:hypothetical protein
MIDNNKDGKIEMPEVMDFWQRGRQASGRKDMQFYYFLDKNAYKICADPRKTTGNRNPTPVSKPKPKRAKKTVAPPKRSTQPRVTNRMFKPIYDFLDVNNNGKVTPSNIRTLFTKLDRTKDMMISKEEFSVLNGGIKKLCDDVSKVMASLKGRKLAANTAPKSLYDIFDINRDG